MLKKLVLIALLITSIPDLAAQAYEYRIITSIESVVPMGLGRSRIISSEEDKSYLDYTTERTEDNKKQNKSKRAEAKVDNFEETKILNFYSATGINFQNIASNDALLSSKVNTMIEN
ncbi:MAG: hypothetical protein WBN13_08650, partial [Robiginitalea sp.]